MPLASLRLEAQRRLRVKSCRQQTRKRRARSAVDEPERLEGRGRGAVELEPVRLGAAVGSFVRQHVARPVRREPYRGEETAPHPPVEGLLVEIERRRRVLPEDPLLDPVQLQGGRSEVIGARAGQADDVVGRTLPVAGQALIGNHVVGRRDHAGQVAHPQGVVSGSAEGMDAGHEERA